MIKEATYEDTRFLATSEKLDKIGVYFDRNGQLIIARYSILILLDYIPLTF
jgi:hypothetical protein